MLFVITLIDIALFEFQSENSSAVWTFEEPHLITTILMIPAVFYVL